MVVFNSPNEDKQLAVPELLHRLGEPGFILFVCSLLLAIAARLHPALCLAGEESALRIVGVHRDLIAAGQGVLLTFVQRVPLTALWTPKRRSLAIGRQNGSAIRIH